MKRHVVPTFVLALGFLAAPPRAQAQGVDGEKLKEIIERATEGPRRGARRKEAPPRGRARARGALRALRRALDTRVVSVNFRGTTFLEAVDFVRDVSGVNIVVSPRARKAFADAEVNLRLKKVRLRSCLNLVLDQVSPDLRYGFKHGVLWIGTADEWKAQRKLVLEIYDVSDITRRPPNFKAPKIGLGKHGVEFED
ncbi:MAG: hypothetical protein D6731_00765 [Planctomycetota bacterium]|nr:MAG: hypothetical protein D6731_00765 [Planctomycetota bacterium]